ncbi:MAG: hypothetical protein UHM08_09330 [Bacteroidales bacterium]|nr:hypothetical protein [Bacteroidales bacterium]
MLIFKNDEFTYPIFIISYNRPNANARTIVSLIKYGIKFNVVVHKEQLNDYKRFFNSPLVNWIIFDDEYKHKYETLSNVDSYEKNAGSGAERNFAWDCAKNAGYTAYWNFDDNMGFMYQTGKLTGSKRSLERVLVKDRNTFVKLFHKAEDFYDSYDNLFIMELGECNNFLSRNIPTINRRCYSALLINTAIPTQWRGRYNEDTIMSIDCLINGFCTVQTPILLKIKQSTRDAKGGNHAVGKGKDDLKNQVYSDAVDYEFSSSLKSQLLVAVYPQYCYLKYRVGRIHHGYNDKAWASFKQRLHPAKVKGQKQKIYTWRVSHNIFNEREAKVK